MKDKDRQNFFLLIALFPVLGLMFFGFSKDARSEAQLAPVTTTEGETGDSPPVAEEEDSESQASKGQTFYKWADEKGNLYFTNDLARVPQRFRDQVETLELPPLPVESLAREKKEEPETEDSPPRSPPIVREVEGEPGGRERDYAEPDPYKEIPFDKFIRIHVGMDEAEVIARLGFPSLVTPSDYFDGYHGKYRSRIIRLIYLGNRDLNEKTTVIEIRDGKVLNIERIFPF